MWYLLWVGSWMEQCSLDCVSYRPLAEKIRLVSLRMVTILESFKEVFFIGRDFFALWFFNVR